MHNCTETAGKCQRNKHFSGDPSPPADLQDSRLIPPSLLGTACFSCVINEPFLPSPTLPGSNSPHGSPTSPLDSNMLLVIIVSVGVITIVIVVIVAVFCTRRTTSHQKK